MYVRREHEREFMLAQAASRWQSQIGNGDCDLAIRHGALRCVLEALTRHNQRTITL